MTRLLPRLLVALIATATVANAQATISGQVRSARTNEPVVGATVLVVGARVGAIVDSTGRYTILGAPAGAVTVRARFLGYADLDQSVTLRDGELHSLDFRLVESVATLGEVRSVATSAEREVFLARPNVGVTLLSGKVASTIPRFVEADVMRAAQMLPGVMARNDFTAGLNVRGGEADQNLILIDGYPIFNPFHMGGLFGTFIDGAADGLELRTGGFPAPYGGRLSAVLDVKSTEESRSGIHGLANISMLSSSATIGSAIGGGKGSWGIAARRTYADKVLQALGKDVVPYFFRDAQAHAAYRLGAKTTVSATFYNGRDDLSGDLSGESADGGTFLFWWGNRVGGATITRQLADSLRLIQQGYYSQFRTQLDLGGGALNLDNTVREIGLRGSLQYHRGTHLPSIGYELARDDMLYTAASRSSGIEFLHDVQRPGSLGAFVNDVWTPNKRLVVEGGLRYERLGGSGWAAVSPRLSAKFFAMPDLAFSVAGGQYSQWLHSLAREDIPIRLFDFWTASDTATPVARAMHLVGGVERWLGTDRFVRLESYVKNYGRLLEANLEDDPNVHGDEYVQLTGRSYGADLLVRQLERGRWGGWIAYTYTFSTRNGPSGTFYPGQDRRNNLNVLASYRSSKRVLWSGRFGYASGTPFTDIVTQVVPRVYNVGTNAWDSEGRNENVQAVGGPRNAEQLPATQRLDFTVTRDYQRGVTLTPFISLINAYNARNVFMYSFDYGATPPTRTAYSQLPLLPTIGLSIAW